MPRVAIVAGINGAGKTTASQRVLKDVLKIPIFVNADAIARGLNGFDPESEAASSGRVMLEYMRKLVDAKKDFSFETTLSGRAYARWLKEMRAEGYEVLMYYFWLNSPETSIERVATRVSQGGHHIPSETIRQRYDKSVRNFFELYRPLCSEWRMYDNSEGSIFVAFGSENDETIILPHRWELIEESASHD